MNTFMLSILPERCDADAEQSTALGLGRPLRPSACLDCSRRRSRAGSAVLSDSTTCATPSFWRRVMCVPGVADRKAPQSQTPAPPEGVRIVSGESGHLVPPD